jgi:hypothetical protein
VLCFGSKENVEHMVSHLFLPMRERAAQAWERVDCMKESTWRRAVGGGGGGHCDCGTSMGWGSPWALGGICGGGCCAGHHMGAPVVLAWGRSSSGRPSFTNSVISGGSSGMDSREICRGRSLLLRVFCDGLGQVRRKGWTFSVVLLWRYAHVRYHPGVWASYGGSNQYIQKETMGYPLRVMGEAAKCRRVFRCEARRVEQTSCQGVWGGVFGDSHCGMGRWNRGGFSAAYLRASARHAVLGSRDPSVTSLKVRGSGCWSSCLWSSSAHSVRQLGHGDWSPAGSHAGLW